MGDGRAWTLRLGILWHNLFCVVPFSCGAVPSAQSIYQVSGRNYKARTSSKFSRMIEVIKL